MQATVLIAHGKPEVAFETRALSAPVPSDSQILIRVEGFGLNYADVMARLGLYPDCPPLPAVLGYEVVGRVERVGADVTRFSAGERVLAFTRFGGYAELAVAEQDGTTAISDGAELGRALALGTQYCTAYYCAEEQVRLHAGDHVLVHAAAGGVGTALVQLAKRRKCVVYGTASSGKLDHLARMGVDHPIDYRKLDFVKEVRRIGGSRGMDVIFDPIGGSTSRRGFKLLGSGGRMVMFGVSALTGATNVVGRLRVVSSFGLVPPVKLLSDSRSLIGVNMLRIGDDRPWVLRRVIESVIELEASGELDPVVGRVFAVDELVEAHRFLESRESIGKIAIRI